MRIPIIGSEVGVLQGAKERTAVCVVAAGESTPDLSGQTLRDYQVLLTASESEALASSDAEAFLWLTSPGKLRPQALEECLWALQSADWVTWADTGAAPPPSLQGLAGPLGIARRVMERPDPKPGGTVRRLPWRCVDGEAERHTPESIVAGGEPRRKERHGLGRALAHIENSGVLSLTRWREAPFATALMAVPLSWKESINLAAGREVFDLSGYLRFQPEAAYVQGKLIRPLRYDVRPRDGRKRVAVAVLDDSFAWIVSGVLGALDPAKIESFIIVEAGASASVAEAEHVYDAGRLVEPGEADRMILSLGLNWEWDVLIVARSMAAYRVLPALKRQSPKLRMADVAEGGSALDLPEETVDSLDSRAATSEALKTALEPLAPGGQGLRVVRRSAIGGSRLPRRSAATVTAGFAGALREETGAGLLPSIVKAAPSEIRWLIAGSGPLEARLRRTLSQGVGRFFGSRHDLDAFFEEIDVLVVPSAGPEGDWAALEAQTRGRAVVGVDALGRGELIGRDSGILVADGRDADLRIAEAMKQLAQDPDLVRKMGEAGAAGAGREFSPEAAKERWQTFMKELLG